MKFSVIVTVSHGECAIYESTVLIDNDLIESELTSDVAAVKANITHDLVQRFGTETFIAVERCR